MCGQNSGILLVEQNSMWKGPEVRGLEGYLVWYEGGQ